MQTMHGASRASAAVAVDIEHVEFVDHVGGPVYAYAVTWCFADEGAHFGVPVTVEVHVECGRREVVGAVVVDADLHHDVEEAVVQAAMAAQGNADILSRYARAS